MEKGQEGSRLLGFRVDVKVSQEDQWGAVLRGGEKTEQSVSLIKKATKRPWGTINHDNIQFNGDDRRDTVELESGNGEMR